MLLLNVNIICCQKDAETSVAEFMESKPIMAEFDARFMHYTVSDVVICNFSFAPAIKIYI